MSTEPTNRALSSLIVSVLTLGCMVIGTASSFAIAPSQQVLNDDGYVSVFTKSSYQATVKGSELADAGQCDKAIPYFKKTVENRPTDVLGWFNLGHCLLESAEETTNSEKKAQLSSEAEWAFERVRDLNPAIDITYYKLGKLAMERGDYKAAKDVYTTGVIYNPENFVLLFNLGVALEKTEDVFAAQQAYEEAIKVNPQFVFAHNNLGLLYEQQNELGKAEAVYREAMEQAPGYNYARLNLGNLLQSEGRLDEAADLYNESVSIEPSNMWGYLYLGNVQFKKADYEEAVKAYNRVIEINPGYSPAYFLSSLALQRLNRNEEALSRGLQYIRLEPNGTFAKEAKDLVDQIQDEHAKASDHIN